jgi:L,D-transpeptidase catalytic domain
MSRIRLVFSLLLPGLVVACAGPDLPDFSSGGGSSGGADYAAAPGPTGSGPVLSAEARRVSQMAERNGDRNYLMLDKARGKIIVFENNRPTFSGAALTGEYPVDYLAPDATQKTFKESQSLKYKVTPAGRYTVAVGYDPAYGDTLDVNEVQGKDWDIAIHRVWLGAPAEHRDVRLRTSSTQDKHITYGCIDVDGSTMQGLLDRLPNEEATPIYILPQDESLIIKFFQPRSAATKVSSPTG